MKDNLEILFYILIVVFSVISSLLRKKKKILPQPEVTTIDDMAEPLPKMMEEKEQAIEMQTAPTTEGIEDIKNKKIDVARPYDTNIEKDKRKKTKQKIKAQQIDDKTNYEEDIIEQMDLRKAIIYSEILNKKYS